MINDDRPLPQFRYPTLPRWWLLLGLLLLCLAINLGWGLLYYANAADRTVSSLTFWTHALGFGLAAGCALLASVLAGFSLMTMRVSWHNRKLAAQHDWQQRRMQEGAAVFHSLLLGPACLTEDDRQQLVQDAATLPLPTATFGEWRIPDLAGSESDLARRAEQLAIALATRLAKSWPGTRRPEAVAWLGSDRAWQVFRLTLQEQGIACPEMARPIQDIEDLDRWIDSLHDETGRHALVMLAGIHLPDAATNSVSATPSAEAGFVLCLERPSAAARTLYRPVQIRGSADLRRAQHNAALERAPVFIQFAAQPVDCAAEAEWVAKPLKIAEYWGDAGPSIPWILLLSALDRADATGQPVGWHVQTAQHAWAGVVVPPAPLHQGENT